jgi:hypothetical protein
LEVEVTHRIGKTALALAAVVVASLVLLTACQPTVPSNINIINNNTNTNQNGQSGQGDPTAVPGSVTAKIKTVTVNGFANGEKCPTGIAPANDNHKIRLGCDLAVTVNPRDENGKTILDDKAPPVDFFVLAAGQDVVDFKQSDSNSYNGDIHSKKAGKFALLASVVGISSGMQEFEVIP